VRIPTATVALVFKAKPSGVAVQIDGHPVDPARLDLDRELDVGTHRIVVRAPGYADLVRSETLRDGERRRVDVDLKSSSGGGSHGTPKWLFFGVASVSAIALGSAAYFAIDATSRAHAEKAKDPLERDPAQQDRIRTESTTANVLFVGGAAIAAGAGVLAFTTDWKGTAPRPTSAARVCPWLGPAGGGIAASGGF
jgi:hypothetical protein